MQDMEMRDMKLDLAAKKAGLQQTSKHTQDELTDRNKIKLNIS